MSADETPVVDGEPLPEALVRSRAGWRLGKAWPHSRWWILTALCLLLAGALVWASLRSRGPSIVVRFREGHGIQPGDALRYRGIDVGVVTRVELTGGLEGVDLRIQLDPAAGRVARQGSRFWIVRPQVSLSRIRGLDTVIGPKYVAVQPGPDDARLQRRFAGEEVPLSLGDITQQEIRIHFGNGHGLVVGDELRYRGLVVGEITALDLTGEGVTVHARLASSAAWLAREGSRFWVERPRVDFQGIRGLETIVGGRYLAVQPGPPRAAKRSEFLGLDSAPIAVDRVSGGLELILEGSHRMGVEAGAPITHRGVQVGQILSVQLAADAASVEMRAYIDAEYKGLVRENTRFWSTSGIDLRIGVAGIRFTADTLATIAAGGVALATPDAAGSAVSTGHRFALVRATDEIEQWQQWRPRLAVGDALLPDGAALPRPQRGLLVWQRRTLGIRRGQQRAGWLLVLDNASALAPADLLVPPARAVDGSAALEVVGQRLALTDDQVRKYGLLAIGRLSLESDDVPRWPAEDLRGPEQPEDCLVVLQSRQGNLPLPTARLEAQEGTWRIDPALPVDADMHGAPVVATRDGAVIGLVVVQPEGGLVVPLPARLLE